MALRDELEKQVAKVKEKDDERKYAEAEKVKLAR